MLGVETEESIKNATEKLGWQTVQTFKTPVGAGDFSQYITPVLNSGADVLILNHYGKDMVNSLTQAVQFGLRDRQAMVRILRLLCLCLVVCWPKVLAPMKEFWAQLTGTGL